MQVTLHGFSGRMVKPGARIITDGPISYGKLPNDSHVGIGVDLRPATCRDAFQ